MNVNYLRSARTEECTKRMKSGYLISSIRDVLNNAVQSVNKYLISIHRSIKVLEKVPNRRPSLVGHSAAARNIRQQITSCAKHLSGRAVSAAPMGARLADVHVVLAIESPQQIDHIDTQLTFSFISGAAR